jgi:CDP-diacylglycerol--serine O-phosphatidyltransferase
MRKGIYLLPNSLTLCGMFAGFYAIISVLKGNYVHAAWGVLIAGVFDGLDGWVARLTHSTTKFGIELDSLSDEIAFGIAPAALLYKWSLMPFGRVGWAASFLFAACGALRLARYNVQMGSTERKSFTGMPIPAAAGFVAATVLFYDEMGFGHHRSLFVLVMTFVLSILMVSTLRFHGAKEIDFSKRKPFWFLVAVAITFAVVVMHTEVALFVLAIIYMIGGLIENSYLLLRKKKPPEKAS